MSVAPGSAEPEKPRLRDDAVEAQELDAEQFERLLRMRALQANRPAPPAPSAFGKLARPATNERTLVLFTLGIVVLLLIVTVFALIAWFEVTEGTVTALTTLAGTGLGFIGGMVSKEKPENLLRQPTTSANPPNAEAVIVPETGVWADSPPREEHPG